METRLREQDGNTKGNNQHHNIKPELQQYNIQNYNMTINKTPKYSPNSKLWVNDPRDHDSLLKQASYWCHMVQCLPNVLFFEHWAFILDMEEQRGSRVKNKKGTGPGQDGTWATGIGFQTCQLSLLSHTGTHMVLFSIFSTPKLWGKKYSPDLCFILTLWVWEIGSSNHFDIHSNRVVGRCIRVLAYSCAGYVL